MPEIIVLKYDKVLKLKEVLVSPFSTARHPPTGHRAIHGKYATRKPRFKVLLEPLSKLRAALALDKELDQTYTNRSATFFSGINQSGDVGRRLFSAAYAEQRAMYGIHGRNPQGLRTSSIQHVL